MKVMSDASTDGKTSPAGGVTTKNEVQSFYALEMTVAHENRPIETY